MNIQLPYDPMSSIIIINHHHNSLYLLVFSDDDFVILNVKLEVVVPCSVKTIRVWTGGMEKDNERRIERAKVRKSEE